MKASELRIGNYVKIGKEHESTNYIGESFKWELNNFYSLDKGYSSIEWFEPIPLTEEWLLKFGFVGPGFKDYWKYKKTDFPYLIKINNKWEAHVCGNFDTITIATIEHVHQIQNLYFALTGEELIII